MSNKKENRGIALAFSLVLLSLLLVIGVSFIILASNDRAASAAQTNAASAKLLVQTAVNRAKLHLYQEINSRQSPDGKSNTGSSDLWAPIAERYFSKASKGEKSNILRTNGAESLQEDIDRLLIRGAEGMGVEWNYITSPDIPGGQAFTQNRDDVRVIGRFAFLGFAGAKISLASTLDSGYQPDNKPERYGFGPRELRPEAVFDADDRSMLTKLAPKTSDYLKVGTNYTSEWPDISTVAAALGYNSGSSGDAAKIINLYENLAVGKLPSPELWRMPTYGEDITGNKLKAYHRFNLHKSQEDWNKFNIDDKWNQDIDEYAWIKKDNTFNDIADGDIGLYYFSGLKPAPLGNLQKDHIRKQLFANLKDYNDNDVIATSDYSSNIDNLTYCGLEKVPYVSDLRVYYAVKAISTGSNTYTVHTELANIEFEMTNLYLNPDLDITNLYFDVHTDFVAKVGGTEIQTTGVQSYKFPCSVSTEGDGISLIPNDVHQRNALRSNGQTRRDQPYFILRDKSEYQVSGTVIQSADVTGTPTFTDFTIKRLIIVVHGDGTYNSPESSSGKSFNNQLLHVHRSVSGRDWVPGGNDYPGTTKPNYNVSNSGNYRYFVTDQSDDPRCSLISVGWEDAAMAGHKGYMKLGFQKAAYQGNNTYQWGSNATINTGATNYWTGGTARYLGTHATDLNGESKVCRDPETDIIFHSSGHGRYRGHAAYMSTCFIRNAPMISPWELGFIHRVRPWQTINLKKYNREYPVTMDFSCEGYIRGDAAILDQIKMTSDYISYGKVNINTANRSVLRALLSEIKYGAKPWEDDRSIPKFDPNNPPSHDPLVFDYESQRVTKDPRASTKNDPIRTTGPQTVQTIPEDKVDYYAEILERYIQQERTINDKSGSWSDWFSRARIVDAFREAQDLDGAKVDIIQDLYQYTPNSSSSIKTPYENTPDAASEELIGKVIGLLEAESGREVAVLAVAQSIQDAKNSSGNYGTYEPGVDRIVGESKVLAIFEYWPKTTPAEIGAENTEYKRSDWVLTKIIYLDPTTGGL